MKRLLLCVSLLAWVIAVPALMDAVYAEVEDEEWEEVAEAVGRDEWEEEKEDDGDAPAILGRNVRLDFKAVPLDEGDQGIFIVTGSSWYETGLRVGGEEGAIEFTVAGEIGLLEDGRIFVRYEARALIDNADGEAEFNLSSGVILAPGQELGVGRMGDKTFMIRASYLD